MMQAAPHTSCVRCTAAGPLRAGFSLAELIVAVGAVALLTIGIGQIFSSVNRLVGTGAAIAETNQAARSIEARLRSDFRALSLMRTEDTFFAIRSRKVHETYLTRDERDADRRAGVIPGDADALARTRRLDEMMFLAFGGDGGGYHSAQVPASASSMPVSAPVARIYYGHGLRPKPDLEYDPMNPPLDRNVPMRHWLPDGDFAQRAGEINRFESGVPVTGRNEYAGSWQLLRQPLLLYGGLAAGPPVGAPSQARSPMPDGLAYAPFIRDYNTHIRCAAQGESLGPDILVANNWPRPHDGWRTFPRPLSYGRVDVCAQSPESLKRWLEGVNPRPNPIPPPPWRSPDATPFEAGRFDQFPFITTTGHAWDSPLWERTNALSGSQAANSWGLKGAIAGAFTRYLAESDPPLIERGDPPEGVTNPQDSTAYDPPNSALMDLHATLASRCSNFEIAWSDGTTWLDDQPLNIDVDGDGDNEVELRQGDIVWFDINFMRRSWPGGNNDLTDQGRGAVYPVVSVEPLAEVPPDRHERQKIARFPTPGPDRTAYPVDASFATGERAIYTCAAPEPEDEYLAIWGYRRPGVDGSDQLAGPWQKPLLIRVRMTLHDAQFRIAGGREYEFILPVNLQ